MSQFESLIIGEIAEDTNVDYDGTTIQAISRGKSERCKETSHRLTKL